MKMKDFVKTHYQELMELMNCIKVGIFIADEEGNVLLLNDESEKTGGMKREELIGRNMRELIDIGYVEDSTILKGIDCGKENSIIQNLGDGGSLYISGVPLKHGGRTELVVCTERDITETENLKELLKETETKYNASLSDIRREESRKQGEIISESDSMKAVIKNAIRIAKLDTTVLINGESGTGKELLANLLHENSGRSSKPYIKINCSAIPENLLESEFFGYESGSFTGADKNGKKGIFELADGGTLFLDEIAELPLQMQPKLLRALQEKEITRIGGKDAIPVDVRIIAATNIDLEEAVQTGIFRQDLYYRLNVLNIMIPPLRSRKEDISSMAVYFIDVFNQQYGMSKSITEDGLEALKSFDWPGNSRQLRNVIERIMVSFDGRYIGSFQIYKHLYGRADGAVDVGMELSSKEWSFEKMMNDYERKILIEAMEKAGSASAAAKRLGVNKSTISRKLKKHHLLGRD